MSEPADSRSIGTLVISKGSDPCVMLEASLESLGRRGVHSGRRRSPLFLVSLE